MRFIEPWQEFIMYNFTKNSWLTIKTIKKLKQNEEFLKFWLNILNDSVWFDYICVNIFNHLKLNPNNLDNMINDSNKISSNKLDTISNQLKLDSKLFEIRSDLVCCYLFENRKSYFILDLIHNYFDWTSKIFNPYWTLNYHIINLTNKYKPIIDEQINILHDNPNQTTIIKCVDVLEDLIKDLFDSCNKICWSRNLNHVVYSQIYNEVSKWISSKYLFEILSDLHPKYFKY